MNFSSPVHRLFINGVSFKAFLEDSQESFEMKEATLINLSVQEKNNIISTRMVRKVKFVFNVFSESEQECVKNYRSYLSLKNSLKPTYSSLDNVYLPGYQNLYGTAVIQFKGLLITSTPKRIDVTNFSYEINKDMGFFGQVPVAFKISIDGIVLQNLKEQTNSIQETLSTVVRQASVSTPNNNTSSTTNTAIATQSPVQDLLTKRNMIADIIGALPFNTGFPPDKMKSEILTTKFYRQVNEIIIINDNTLELPQKLKEELQEYLTSQGKNFTNLPIKIK